MRRCLEGEGEPYPSVEISYEDGVVWFYADGSGDVEFTANLIREFLANFSLDNPITFEWAYYCDRPRPGEFGGGAVFISKDGMEFFTTGEWVAQKMAGRT